ncbi:hypothetical protein [Sideroxydans sp. CL21]|uniref:hypothetical protein n=1 Tax=Sideroxydans sp. CL21 TaxID=2600596 RepID=UPI0024BC6E22|nr:hypothetical protein [Sideroxydans sp. CL21]
MSDRRKSRIHSGVVFAALFAIFALASCGGGSAAVGAATGTTPRSCSAIQNTTPTQPSISTIAATDAAIVATPYINSGASVQYYCDCSGPNQACAAAGSTQGSDTAGSGTQASPYQTIDAAMTWLNGGANRTAALCRGGSFTPTSTGIFVFVLSANASCASGSICNELREYPIGGAGLKPIINTPTGNHYLISTTNGGGGYRFMNLKLQGSPFPHVGGQAAFFLYSNASIGMPPVHDIAIENVDMDSFDTGVQDTVTTTNNITIIGNHFTNILNFGYLGGTSNLTVSYNSFVDTGSDNKFDHAVYLASHEPVSNVSIVGNFIKGFSTVSGSTKCMGSPLIGHAAVTNLTVSGNVVIEDMNADPGCYGMGFNNTTGAAGGIFYRNALFSDNIVVNGGNNGINITSCPSCAIENNLIISQSDSGGAAISTPASSARPQDDVECYAKIVNNTAYYETTSTQGMTGIVVSGEGSGHIVANNTVMYTGISHALNSTSCFSYNLPLASYDFINNNNCFSNDPVTIWVYRQPVSTLADWQKYSATAGLSGTGFDTASSFANPCWSFATPLTIPTLDETQTGAQLFKSFFAPPAGSPLLGKGNTANAPATDITNTARSAASSIGAYQ